MLGDEAGRESIVSETMGAVAWSSVIAPDGELTTILRSFDETTARFGPGPGPGSGSGSESGLDSTIEPRVSARVRSCWSLATPTWHRFVQVHLWSASEWSQLVERPTDVQVCADGTRVAVRIL